MTRKALPTYVFSIDKVQNQAAAYNFISLFNPAGSGKVLIVGAVFISSTLLTSSSIADSMRGFRITTASGGTLQDASAIAKIQSHWPDPTGVIRTGNPTVTLGAALFNSPAPIEDKHAPVHEVDLPAGSPPLTLVPGEGVVLRTAAGIGVGSNWNMSVAWSEGP